MARALKPVNTSMYWFTMYIHLGIVKFTIYIHLCIVNVNSSFELDFDSIVLNI